MRLFFIIVFALTLNQGWAQLQPLPTLVSNEIVNAKFNTTDTVDLFAKRDTGSFANSIRSTLSIVTGSSNGYYKTAYISATTTLTASSAEYIRTTGSIVINLPDPATCFDSSTGLGRKFTFTKLDIITTLDIKYAGQFLWTTNSAATASFLATSNGWMKL